MSGSSYKHKSGATKCKEKEKRAQEKTKLKKLDTYFVRPNPGDEADIVVQRGQVARFTGKITHNH